MSKLTKIVQALKSPYIDDYNNCVLQGASDDDKLKYASALTIEQNSNKTPPTSWKDFKNPPKPGPEVSLLNLTCMNRNNLDKWYLNNKDTIPEPLDFFIKIINSDVDRAVLSILLTVMNLNLNNSLKGFCVALYIIKNAKEVEELYLNILKNVSDKDKVIFDFFKENFKENICTQLLQSLEALKISRMSKLPNWQTSCFECIALPKQNGFHSILNQCVRIFKNKDVSSAIGGLNERLKNEKLSDPNLGIIVFKLDLGINKEIAKLFTENHVSSLKGYLENNKKDYPYLIDCNFFLYATKGKLGDVEERGLIDLTNFNRDAIINKDYDKPKVEYKGAWMNVKGYQYAHIIPHKNFHGPKKIGRESTYIYNGMPNISLETAAANTLHLLCESISEYPLKVSFRGNIGSTNTVSLYTEKLDKCGPTDKQNENKKSITVFIPKVRKYVSGNLKFVIPSSLVNIDETTLNLFYFSFLVFEKLLGYKIDHENHDNESSTSAATSTAGAAEK